MQTSPAPRTRLYAGTIVVRSGQYRIHHSIGHRPDTETFLGSGLILPRCYQNDCVVSFELLLAAIDQSGPLKYRTAV